MNPAKANLLAAAVLVVMGLWGYLGSASPSPTALIPVAFGVLFAIFHPWMKKENKIVAHIIVVLTLLILVALFKPLTSALSANNSMAILRIGLMMLICLIAMVVYIKSFINARKNK